MSVRRSNRRLQRSNAVDESSPVIVVPSSIKHTKRLRKIENLICVSADTPLKEYEYPKKGSPLIKPKTPRRKIIRAKRVLNKPEKTEPATGLDDEKATFDDKQKTEVEGFALTKENGHNDDDIKTATEAATNNEVKENETEVAKEIENKSLNTSKNRDIIVTTLNSPISPSTSSEDLKTPNSSQNGRSSFEQFNSSKEFLQPSTSGCVEESAPRRRTFELESSVNDISILKVVSLSDSHRMNSFPSEDSLPSPIPTSKVRNSKVTLRKKIAENNTAEDRISVTTPPWSQKSRILSDSTPAKTPLPATKPASLLKTILNKGNNKSTIKKPVSGVKVPNFAAIHQKAFDRMESLSEYKQRKEQRAKMLLSGRKPEEMKNANKRMTPKNESRKQLRFAADVCDKIQSPTYIPLPSTPLPKKFKMVEENVKIKTPIFNFPKGKENPFIISKPAALSTQKFGKETGKNEIPVLLPKNNIITNLKCKKEEIKLMVATKSKLMKNTTTIQREIIKGVRSNRRFELMMKMRKGK